MGAGDASLATAVALHVTPADGVGVAMPKAHVLLVRIQQETVEEAHAELTRVAATGTRAERVAAAGELLQRAWVLSGRASYWSCF